MCFKDGSQYEITLTNKERRHFAVTITIDGRKVTKTPMVIFPMVDRKVSGFTDKTTSSRETNADDGSPGHYQIEKEVRSFVACKPLSCGSVVDPECGVIEFSCFPVRWVKNTPRTGVGGPRTTRNKQGGGGAGRAGVLMTVGGKPKLIHGFHPGKPSIPIANKRAGPLLVYTITVCERS